MADSVLTFFTGYSALDASVLVLKGAAGREAMSSLYEYELTLEVNREGGLAAEDLDGLFTEPCAILMTGTFSIEIHGVLRELELLASNEGVPVIYRALLVPRLWNTTRSYRSRVYQDVNVKEVVDQVLSLSDQKAEWWLVGSYPKREYIVQYEETDFAFISRQLEHWGIFYFFRQEPDGEVLVITDDPRAFTELDGHETLEFNPRGGRTGVGGSVHSLGAVHRPQPAGVVVRDYNYRTPSTLLLSECAVDTRAGAGLQWYYGDRFRDEAEGEQIARIRSEQLLNRRESYKGVCSVAGLAPGHKFELLDCPIPDLNIAYVVTSVEPRISVTGDRGDEAYEYPFTAYPLERDDPPVVPYRSQRVTAMPQIEGFMHGFVDGEASGTAAPIDDLGRYKILLPFDTVASPGGRASRFIRMAQPSSGAGYGTHFPLHIGVEVAIVHLDGDPDRPVIMASVPNAEARSPVTRENASQSRIRTGSGIIIEMDDDVV